MAPGQEGRGGERAAAQAAYYVAYSNYSTAYSDYSSQWTTYVNSLLSNASIQLGSLAV